MSKYRALCRDIDLYFFWQNTWGFFAEIRFDVKFKEILDEGRNVGSKCRALVKKYRPLWWKYRGVLAEIRFDVKFMEILDEGRNVGSKCRALVQKYRPLWWKYREVFC